MPLGWIVFSAIETNPNRKTEKMANFAALLNVKADTVEKPKPLPQGTYLGTITGHEFDESQKKKTPFVRFHIQPVSPEPDVDEELFTEFGGQAKLASKKQRTDFYLTEDSMFRLTDFLKDVCKLDADGRTLAELIPETTGVQIKFNISHSINNGEVYANIADMAAVD